MPFRFQRHTGELAVRLEAPSLEQLFVEAARAVASIAAERTARDLEPPVELCVRGHDAEAQLVAWLDELIFRIERNGEVPREVSDVTLDGDLVRATVRGGRILATRTAIKAATLHDLHVERTADGVQATVVLDV